jgi:hypothetical protein
MRNLPGYLYALATAVVISACSFGNTSGQQQVDAAHEVPTCGDGVCAASEVDNCPVDCGTHAAPDAGTTQPDAGTTGGDAGVMGTCDPTACITCITGGACPTGYDATSCITCLLGGSGSGSGSGSCNMDFVCDIGEDITSCIDCIIAGDTACDGNSPDGTCEADESVDTCPTDCM